MTGEVRSGDQAHGFVDAILDTVAALVVVVDPTGHVLRCNTAFLEATGFDLDDVLGGPLLERMVPAEHHDAAAAEFARLVQDRTPRQFEGEILTADGRRRRIRWNDALLVDAAGDLQAVIGTGLDVTEQRSLEDRLAQRARLESVGRLAAGLAHDFNNTLTVLQARVERIAGRGVDGATEADLAAISRTIERTSHLISELLSFSGAHQLALEPMDVNVEIARMAEMVADLLGEGIDVVLDLTDADTTVTMDAARFDQIVTNLVLNARDAMPDGGVLSITTAVQDAASGEVVRVVVSDSGTGMAPGVLSRVFDPYFTTKPSTKGTGLGLATAYGTIVRAGGDIVIESEPGAGTTVSLALPRRHPDAAADDGGRWIMVVDDDEELLAVLVDELIDAGYAVVGATNAEDVDRFLDVTDPPALDVLVTDVQLPGRGGAHVVDAVRRVVPDIPVVFITGAAADVVDQFTGDEATLLRKPFGSGVLTRAVGDVLGRTTGQRTVS